MRLTEPEYRAFLRNQARRLQLPLGRGVAGLDKPRGIVVCPYEAVEAEALTRWAMGYWLGGVWVAGEGFLAYPDLEWLHHVPNGGWRSWKVANALKRQGVKAGPWDYFLDVPRGGYHGARLELKRRAGGGLSPEQKRWGSHYEASGYFCIVARGWEEARDKLIEYLETV